MNLIREYPGETLGERLSQARHLRGWTQREMAAYLRRTRRPSLGRPFVMVMEDEIHRWESDTHKPQRPTLFALARLLRYSVGWLENGS